MADEGIQERHQDKCATQSGGKRCNCRRSYRASVYDPDKKKNAYSGWKRDKAEVVKWRTQALRELQEGATPTDGPLLREAWAEFIEGARSGAIGDRKGNRYKSQTLDSYKAAWDKHVGPRFGSKRMSKVRHGDVQALADELAKNGAQRSTVNNALDPLRVLYRRAMRRHPGLVNPTSNIELPAKAEEEVRPIPPARVAELLAALPDTERALWATAVLAGLRSGELRAITWDYVDLKGGVITVLRAWGDEDADERTKSRAGKRRVPIVPQLRTYLEAHKRTTGRSGDDLVFGRTAKDPFYRSTVRSRALKAWKDAGLEPVSLHRCRHTAASFLIAAGCNAKALSTVIGHSSIDITFNRYGHLIPGHEDEVARRLSSWLEEHLPEPALVGTI